MTLYVAANLDLVGMSDNGWLELQFHSCTYVHSKITRLSVLRIGRSEIPFSNDRHRNSSNPLSNRLENTFTLSADIKIEKNPIPKWPIDEYPDAWIPGNSRAARSLAQKTVSKVQQVLRERHSGHPYAVVIDLKYEYASCASLQSNGDAAKYADPATERRAYIASAAFWMSSRNATLRRSASLRRVARRPIWLPTLTHPKRAQVSQSVPNQWSRHASLVP